MLRAKVLSQVGEVDLFTDPPWYPACWQRSEQPGVSHLFEPGFSIQPVVLFWRRELPLHGAGRNDSQALLVVGGQAFQASLLSPGRRITSTAGELQKLVNRVREPGLEEGTALVAPEEPAVIEEVVEEAKPEDLAAVDALFSRAAEKDMKIGRFRCFLEFSGRKQCLNWGKENGFLSYDEARKLG